MYRLRPEKSSVSGSCADRDNKTHSPIHHSLEQYTSFLLQTRTCVSQIHHQRYNRVRPGLLPGLDVATMFTIKILMHRIVGGERKGSTVVMMHNSEVTRRHLLSYISFCNNDNFVGAD